MFWNVAGRWGIQGCFVLFSTKCWFHAFLHQIQNLLGGHQNYGKIAWCLLHFFFIVHPVLKMLNYLRPFAQWGNIAFQRFQSLH